MKTNFLVVGLMVLLGVSVCASPVGPTVVQQTLTTTPAGALVNAGTNFFTSNLSLMEQALTGWMPGNGTASFATNATYSKYAGLATNAITATTATSALTAIVATTALTATVATNALTANLATTATMAGYALAAGTATNTPFGPAGNLASQNSNSVVITGGTINGAHSGNAAGLTNLPVAAINAGTDSVALMSQVAAQIAAATNGLGAGAVGTSSTNGPVTYSGVVNSSALSGTNNFAANVNVGHVLSANYVNAVNLQAAQINASAVNAGSGLEANMAMWNVGVSDQWQQYGGSNQDDSIYWDDWYGAGHTLQLSNNLMVVTGTIQATKFVGSTGANITNGLATTAYVNTATNGFVGANVTNGLATTAYVTAAVAASGGGSQVAAGTVVGIVVTNTATNYDITVTGAGTAADNGTYALGASGIVGATLYTNVSNAKGIFQMASVANWGIGTWSNTTLVTLDYVTSTPNLAGIFNAVLGNYPVPTANTNWAVWTTAQWVATNVSVGNLAAVQFTGSVTNQFVTPAQLAAQINVATNGMAYGSTNGLATTAYVNTATNGLVTAAVTNGLATTAYVSAAIVASSGGPTNGVTSGYVTAAINTATNGLVTAAVTNGLATVAYVTAAINTATNGLSSGGGSTNGLATIAYVNIATNGLVTASVTNGLAATAYVNTATNTTYAFALALGVNETNYVNASTNAANAFALVIGGNDTNFIKASTNGLVTAAVTNGLATTGYALALGQNSSNYVSAATNTLANNLPGFLQGLVSTRSSYTNMTSVTNGSVVTFWPAPNITVMEEAVPQIPAAFAWVAVVDLANQTKIYVTPPNPGASLLMTNDTIKCQVLPFMQTNGAFLGINGNLFSYVDSNPYAKVVGFSASAGQVCSPFTTQPPVDGGGQYPNQSYAIVGNAPAINIDPNNNATIVTRGASGTTIAQTGTTVWNAFSGSAQILTAGLNTVPTYTTSGGPLTVMNGYSDANSWYALNTARVSMSINQAGNKLYIVVIDSTNSTYLTVSNEVNFVLLDHTYLFPTAGNQPYNGLSMDGGGSACMAWVNPVTQTAGIINPSGQINQRSCALDVAIGYQGAVAPALPGNLVALATSPLGNFGTNALVGGNLIPAPGGVLSPTNMPLNIYVNNVTFTNGITGVTNATAPANTTTVRVWINFTNTAGVLFKLPGYQ